jgi:hypothetical protein
VAAVVVVLIGTIDAAAQIDDSWSDGYVRAQHLPWYPDPAWYRPDTASRSSRTRSTSTSEPPESSPSWSAVPSSTTRRGVRGRQVTHRRWCPGRQEDSAVSGRSPRLDAAVAPRGHPSRTSVIRSASAGP